LLALPSYDSLSLLSQSFAKFFSDKMHKLYMSLLINHTSAYPHFTPPFTPPYFISFKFTCATTDEYSKILSQSPDTNCDLEPNQFPTTLLKQCSHILLHTITNKSIYQSLLAFFLINSKAVHILTSKKSHLDKDDLSNYRPISHLSFCQNSLKA